MVEDEDSVRSVTRLFLMNLGYTVLAAESPTKALEAVEDHAGPIDVLITDVVMPDMNGRQLAEQLQATLPNLKCLFISGYTANVIAHHGILDDGVNFLSKPFTRDELARKVKQVLTSA